MPFGFPSEIAFAFAGIPIVPRPIGFCKLCGLEQPLADSHLIPKSFYKLVTDGSHGPTVLGPEGSHQSTQQMKTYLLCDVCEQRFNAGGENWVHGNSLRIDGSFPLRDALQKTAGSPFTNGSTYSGLVLGNDIDKLVYFAASVFWRAAVHKWKYQNGVTSFIQLGPFEEKFRNYLLDKATFPDHSVLNIAVASDAAPLKAFTPPSGDKTKHGYFQYHFHIPGMLFSLLVGQKIPAEMIHICAVRSQTRIVVVTDKTDKLLTAKALSFLS